MSLAAVLTEFVAPLGVAATGYLVKQIYHVTRQVRKNEKMTAKHRIVIQQLSQAVENNHDVDIKRFWNEVDAESI